MDLTGLTNYILHIAVLSVLFGISGLSLNLTMGLTGLEMFCIGALGGVAGYTSAILATKLGLGFFIALPVAVVLTVVISTLLGLVLLRNKGSYFALCAVGFNVIFIGIVNNWVSLTNGPYGISAIPRPEIFGYRLDDPAAFLILSILFLVVAYHLCEWVEDSDFGRVLKGIREDEKLIQSLGYNTQFYKLAVMGVSGAVIAVETVLFASYISYIDAANYNLDQSIIIISMVILGGLASNKGVVIGAAILAVFPEALRFVGFPPDIAAQTRVLVYGILLIVLMIYRPQGLMGKYRL